MGAKGESSGAKGKGSGANTNSELVNSPSTETEKYTVFNSYEGSMKWFANPDCSNLTEWRAGLTSDELKAIKYYTGSSYSSYNALLYGKDWDTMTSSEKASLSAIYNGLSKFDLKRGIMVTRQCDFQIFGASKGHKMTESELKDLLNSKGEIIHNNGFLSFGANNKGASIAGSGLVIKLRIPPSKGAGAYVNPISTHSGSGENEFLVNNNSLLRFDKSSIHTENGKVVVDAYWIGQTKSQHFDKK